MKRIIFTLLIISLLTNCNNPQKNDRFELVPEPDKALREEYEKLKEISKDITGHFEICDTCNSVLVVSHDECTECADIYVDSGTVYIPRSIVFKFDSLRKSANGRYKRFVTEDMYFDDKFIFNKLWHDSVYSKIAEGNVPVWDKTYRLKGKVLDIKYRVLENGIVEPTPRLYFKILSWELLPDKK